MLSNEFSPEVMETTQLASLLGDNKLFATMLFLTKLPLRLSLTSKVDYTSVLSNFIDVWPGITYNLKATPYIQETSSNFKAREQGFAVAGFTREKYFLELEIY